MSFVRLSLVVLTGASLTSLALVAGGRFKGDPKGDPPEKPVNEIVQEFPTRGEKETAWKVHWQTLKSGSGLVITGAWFKPDPMDGWMKVIGNIRLSEIFVPYNNSTRIYDI